MKKQYYLKKPNTRVYIRVDGTYTAIGLINLLDESNDLDLPKMAQIQTETWMSSQMRVISARGYNEKGSRTYFPIGKIHTHQNPEYEYHGKFTLDLSNVEIVN